MKASVLKERCKHIDTRDAHVDRKHMYKYLQILGDTAIDIFHGNHEIDELDKILLEDGDRSRAFDAACAVMSYRLLSVYGATGRIDHEIFTPFSFKDCEDGDLNSFMCCELAYEYGRQLHQIIAKRAQEEIEDDLKGDS